MDKNLNNGLFGFLKKRPLFQNSPNNNSSSRKSRNRSRSKESRFSDKLSHINALDQQSIGSASKVEERPEKFNYVYANAPQNGPFQQSYFAQAHQNINKHAPGSFTQNYSTLGQKNSGQNRFMGLQPTPILIENGQQNFSSDLTKNYHSTLPTSISPQNNNRGSFTSSMINNYGSSLPGNNANINNPPLQEPFQAMQKVVKNADYGSNRFQAPFSPQTTKEGGGFQTRQQDDQQQSFKKSVLGQQDSKVWMDLTSSSTNFEAARLQSIQCLQNLSFRIGSQISNINIKIQSLNAKMVTVLNREFQQIRRKITEILQSAFREKQKYIYDYMSKKQVELAGEMLKIRQTLLRQGQNIERMKQTLRTVQWRQAAGQILSSQLQKKVVQIIQKSQEMQLGQWEIGDFASTHILNIQRQFRQLMNLANT